MRTIVKLNSEETIIHQIQGLRKPEEQDVVILLLKDKHDTLRQKLKNDIKSELMKKKPLMKEDEAGNISDQILEKILKHKSFESLTELYKEIDRTNKKFGIRLDQKETVKNTKAFQKTKNEYQTAILQKRLMSETDPKEQKKQQLRIQELQKEKRAIEM